MRDVKPRVVHVNDVAGVASAAVRQAVGQGLDWRLWTLPAVRGAAAPVKVLRRARDVVRFRAEGRAADVVHVHYGLFAYYAWSVRRPYLLHLHGSDVHRNLASPMLRPAVLAGIRRAGVVAFSTPDLAATVTRLRRDAVWLPAPVHPDLITAPLAGPADGPSGAPTVVFASRWDPVKGLDVLLEAAGRLRDRRPDLRLLGVDWGSGADRARRIGVELVPRAPAAQFRALLAAADVVVGQQASGCLGVADLEAMTLGRPLVARFTERDAYGEDAPLWNTTALDPADAVLAALDDPGAAADRGRAGMRWVLRHHSPEAFVRSALTLYERIRDDGAHRGRGGPPR